MVVIDQETLDKLKCGECDGYLSCAPVLLKEDGNSICGRCSAPEDLLTIRNKPYEELAKVVEFPCRYQEIGCDKKVCFSELSQHEESCGFRQYICPVVDSGICEWVGPRDLLFEHCTEEHPEKVLQNPCTLTHDIKIDSLASYLMTVYNVLFLIQTKVCITTRKIYHSVRLIGDSERVNDFSFDLEIKNSGGQLKKQKIVAPQGCMALQEDTSIVTDINSLLSVLGTFDGTTFKISLNKLVEEGNCVKCGKVLVHFVYGNTSGWLCENCAPPKQPCKYRSKGCMHMDRKSNIDKHMRFYCIFSTRCWICHKTIMGTFDAHCKLEHPGCTNESGEIWAAKPRGGLINQWHFINSDVGTLVCQYGYFLFSSMFVCFVYSPLRSEELNNYSCELRLIHPTTGYTLNRTLDVTYDEIWDWRTAIGKDGMSSVLSDGQCNVQIEIIRKVPTS